MRRLVAFVALAALAAGAVWSLRGRSEAPPDPRTRATPPAGVAPTATAVRRPQRSPIPSFDPRQPGFEEMVDGLVDLGIQTWEALEADDDPAARELDEQTRTEVTTLTRLVDASDEKALHALCGLLSEDTTLSGRVRRKVLLTIVEVGLRARWQQVDYGGSRASADRLVEAMLVSLPQDELLARELGLEILANEPFLGATHERCVLEIVERSTREEFLASVAEALLTTLWRNLERDGSRSSTELASLALLFAEDTNPSRRLAALRHLLTADSGRYEQFAVDLVVRSGDRDLAREIAMTGATELPPKRALRVLERLADIESTATTAAFLMLGQRDPDTLRNAYEQKLADRIAPHVRAELVTGAGFRGDAVDVAQLAFTHDPDPEVRTRAMFVLSAQATPEVAERTLLEALDDPRFADREDRVGAVVAALRNIALAGEVNAVDRIGRRMLVHPHLGDEDRRRVEELLARYTPR